MTDNGGHSFTEGMDPVHIPEPTKSTTMKTTETDKPVETGDYKEAMMYWHERALKAEEILYKEKAVVVLPTMKTTDELVREISKISGVYFDENSSMPTHEYANRLRTLIEQNRDEFASDVLEFLFKNADSVSKRITEKFGKDVDGTEREVADFIVEQFKQTMK